MIRYSRLSFRSWLRQKRPPYLQQQTCCQDISSHGGLHSKVLSDGDPGRAQLRVESLTSRRKAVWRGARTQFHHGIQL